MPVNIETSTDQIGIIGIGNLLLSDEGFGIHVIQYLEEHYSFPESVQLMDAGTAAIYMAPFMESVSTMFVIDVVNLEDEPGSIHCYKDNEVKAGLIPTKMSPHQLGLLEMLDICRLRDLAPKSVEFICVVPKSLETSMTLSPVIEKQIPKVIKILMNRLAQIYIIPALI
jgi:hydrogenase maturation protease